MSLALLNTYTHVSIYTYICVGRFLLMILFMQLMGSSKSDDVERRPGEPLEQKLMLQS